MDILLTFAPMNTNKKALLLINLGSPDSFSVPDVRRYLNEFLMDERVIDVNALWRNILVKGIIVPFRAPKSAHAYQSVWTDKGSPLVVLTDEFKEQLQTKLNMPVAVCMRYANPTPAVALKELENKVPGLEELLIAPMYPHYAMSSYETALEHVKDYLNKQNKNIKLKVLKPFYNEPAYITSLAESIKPYLAKNNFDAYLFSYHGLPARHIKKTDPTKNHCLVNGDCCEVKSIAWDFCYRHQVKATTKLVTEKLNLDAAKVLLSFQSRLGKGWLEPFTDVMFTELPKKGIKKLLVITPSFVTDCLETLEEINIRGKNSFLESGGEEFTSAPCLNSLPQWVDAFAGYCNNYEGEYKLLWN